MSIRKFKPKHLDKIEFWSEEWKDKSEAQFDLITFVQQIIKIPYQEVKVYIRGDHKEWNQPWGNKSIYIQEYSCMGIESEIFLSTYYYLVDLIIELFALHNVSVKWEEKYDEGEYKITILQFKLPMYLKSFKFSESINFQPLAEYETLKDTTLVGSDGMIKVNMTLLLIRGGSYFHKVMQINPHQRIFRWTTPNKASLEAFVYYLYFGVDKLIKSQMKISLVNFYQLVYLLQCKTLLKCIAKLLQKLLSENKLVSLQNFKLEGPIEKVINNFHRITLADHIQFLHKRSKQSFNVSGLAFQPGDKVIHFTTPCPWKNDEITQTVEELVKNGFDGSGLCPNSEA